MGHFVKRFHEERIPIQTHQSLQPDGTNIKVQHSGQRSGTYDHSDVTSGERLKTDSTVKSNDR